MLKKYDGIPTFHMKQTKKKENLGVIIFIHPGTNLDFSPRWDTILMALCDLGFDIYAPNYPGSTGYGKTFGSATLSQTVAGLKQLTKSIQKINIYTPTYFLSFSSGSVLMDLVLASDIKVDGAISVMGIPSNLIKKKCPMLYFLGKNDPRTPYTERVRSLKSVNVEDDVYTFENEGHWIRKPTNNVTLIRMIYTFMHENR